MPLAEDDDMVKALPPGRANQPFRMSILPWRAGRSWPVSNAHGTKSPGEKFAIDSVAVAEDAAFHSHVAGFGELPGHPFGAGVSVQRRQHRLFDNLV
jgi:hypothetical protein